MAALTSPDRRECLTIGRSEEFERRVVTRLSRGNVLLQCGLYETAEQRQKRIDALKGYVF
jgi:hypothetical protein